MIALQLKDLARHRPIHSQDGWTVWRAPVMMVRPRVLIVKLGGNEYAAVWEDCWRDALGAAMKDGVA